MLLDRTTPPSSKQIDSVDFIQPTKYTLDNHIPFRYKCWRPRIGEDRIYI